MSLFAQIADAYRKTRKPKDILWNRFVARPLAAVLIPLLGPTRITPNQVTFASLAVFLGAAAVMVSWRGHLGLIVAAVVLELSYVLDCVDGQLARLRGTSSPVGAHLDFLMDELKAFLLVACAGTRLWQQDGRSVWLLEALFGLCAVASAISLTGFVRRPEYLAATGAARPKSAGDYGDGFVAVSDSKPRSLVQKVMGAVEGLGRLIVHYPSYIVFIAAANRLDIFLRVYIAINMAYAARTILAVARKLGRSGT